MIARFTEFFLKNQKITFIFILLIAIFGLLSYILLPKQYNPSIVAPAFSIDIPAYGYDASEGHEYVVKSIENKVRELVGVDKIYGYATDGYVSVMVAFKVGVDAEDAKTRLYDKMYSNYDLKPYGISDVRIRSIDPEDLPQVSYAIIYKNRDQNTTKRGQYLQNIGKNLREAIKTVPGTTVIDIVGGYSNDVYIELIPERIESFGLDIAQVVQKLQQNFGKYQVGEVVSDGKKYAVTLDYDTDTLKRVESFPILVKEKQTILLKDIASIKSGPIDIMDRYELVDHSGSHDAVFLGVSKLKGTNSVHVVENVHEVVNELKKSLPKNVEIITIQDEGETAREATNELMLHLFVSIAIVLVILIIFLGVRDAVNAAFCIPMVLGIVFIVALVLGLDINRITLFALILSLGILVDDSIVMVENNSRHLAMIPRTGKSKFEAIIDSVKEVGVSIVVSTITRIMSFVAMFAVTGMMGDYMKPIPIFASIALTASLVVAFSINPFLASFLYRPGTGGHHGGEGGKFLKWYGKKLAYFINRDEATAKKRSWLKIGFWISLVIILVLPILLDVFKARMLPKADKNQVYLWIDAPRNASIETTKQIARDTEIFLMGYKRTTVSGEATASGESRRILPEELQIIETISTGIGDRILPDFANLFRGGNNRTLENQISMRINLTPSHDRDIASEEFVIKLRPMLREYLYKKYPDIKLRLLEDPPGPPTQATFQMKMKGAIGTTESELIHFAESVEQMVRSVADKQDIVDLTNSHSSASPGFKIILDHERIARAGLTEEQVRGTLEVFFGNIPLSILRHEEEKYGASAIEVSVSRENKKDATTLKSLIFTNQRGEKIALSDIAEVKTDFKSYDVYTDERTKTIHLYGEMGENSVVYPVLELYSLLGSPEFEKMGYKKISASPYAIQFIDTKTGKHFMMEWGGEWELTMDTFRDLGLAMIFSLFVIYFIIVTQFGSFLVGGIVMTTFLLSFFGIFPGFSILYLISGTYFTATAMIGAIALGGIVVGNALILIDYINQLIAEGKSLEYAVIHGSEKRFVPVMLTSVAAVAGSFIITSDPVWSGLAWSIIWGLSASAVLTLYFIPIFYYTYLRKYHKNDANEIQYAHIIEHEKELLQNQ